VNTTVNSRTQFAPQNWIVGLWSSAWQGDALLMRFASVLLVLLLPMAIGFAVDPRELRGASVWIKPMKFALSIAVLAWTTAYFMSHVHASRQRGLATVRWIVIGAGTFELAYIAAKAALGEGSHYNVGDAFHRTLYTLMGIGAVMLTGSQALLAWLVARHAVPGLHSAYRLAVVVGLSFAFVLGTASGVPLSAIQPPNASALPIVGWHLLGDLRPAHFVGLHAEQALPLLGGWLAARQTPNARGLVVGASVLWLVLFAVLMAAGLSAKFNA
jgi:hypothetical protein